MVRDAVEVAVTIGIVEVDRGRRCLLSDRQDRVGCLHSPCRSQQVALIDFVALIASRDA